MYCISVAAHSGVAHTTEHTHYSIGPADDVYEFDTPNVEGMTVVSNALSVLPQTSLLMLGQLGAMESVRKP